MRMVPWEPFEEINASRYSPVYAHVGLKEPSMDLVFFAASGVRLLSLVAAVARAIVALRRQYT